jgi:histidinol dehydrogenase
LFEGIDLKIINFGEFQASAQEGVPQRVMDSVTAIMKDVRSRGDEALLDLTEKYDGVRIAKKGLRLEQEDLKAAYEGLPEDLKNALANSVERIRKFQKPQMPEPVQVETAPGVVAGTIFDPVESAGIYVPGGIAAYPSTVIMTVVPAKVAGVKRAIVFTPPGRSGRPSEAVMGACFLAGADEVYVGGGAQAIAAMAYGTGTVEKVEKIVGPGNIYVMAAKMLVSQDVSVDMPAGPSEVMIYAEEEARAGWIAVDIMAQAEHDPRSRAVLVTPNLELARRVVDRVDLEAKSAPRKEILKASLANAEIVIVEGRNEGIRAINKMGPEHLQIFGDDADEIMKSVRNAGAVFLGDYSAVPLGDYTAGTNHVLPTMGWSRRASPLSVRDFLRAREFLRCTRDGIMRIGVDAMAIARAEGLSSHARSIDVRMKEDN